MKNQWVVPLVSMLLACEPPEEPPFVSSGGGGGVSAGGATSQLLIGGTIAVLDESMVAVSDPERDAVNFVSISARRTVGRVMLRPGDRPARAVFDGDKKLQVVLRGTGELATIDPEKRVVLSRTAVCPEPRGLTWNAASQALLVACATGELVTLSKIAPMETRRLGADLRDVVAEGSEVRVSTFRTPRLLQLGERPFDLTLPEVLAGRPMAPTVATRMVSQGGTTVIVHQHAAADDVSLIGGNGAPVRPAPPTVPYYGAGLGASGTPCNPAVVRTAVSLVEDGRVTGTLQVPGVVPMDAALSPSGSEVVVVHAGNGELSRLPLSRLRQAQPTACAPMSAPLLLDADGRRDSRFGSPVGVAFLPNGTLLVHSREPSRLFVLPPTGQAFDLGLVTSRVETPGQRLFYEGVGGIACASCHPEGHDDGHTWLIEGKRRRTQALAGGLKATAPFHWEGDRKDFTELLEDTFVRRMGGILPDAPVIGSLERMLDGVPPLRPPSTDTPVDLKKGRAVFEKAGCQGCHSGPKLTNDLSFDVGTGERLQVPSLVGVAGRGPWMHDGCAKTLTQRFTNETCGGKRHGSVSTLSAEELGLLVAFIEQQ